MFKNYLNIAIRNFWKNKTFSLLNILGLTAGTVCSLYILFFIKDQWSFDKHHLGVDQIYRVTTDILKEGKIDRLATISPPIAPAMKKEFPEIEAAVRVINPPDVDMHLIKSAQTTFYIDKGYYTDSTFFRIFTYRFTEGISATALDQPYTMVISSGIAKRLFGNTQALNQRITLTNRLGTNDFLVTGVFDENFGKSHISPNFFMSINSGGMGDYVRTNNQWAGQNFIFAYVKLNPQSNPSDLEKKLPAFIERYGGKQLKELGFHKTLHLQPVKDIYVYSDLKNEISKKTNASFLYLLLIIGGFIQLIACINFMNLSTAKSSKRAREIGVRKSIGATRSGMLAQFMTESMLMTGIAFGLALPMLYILMPALNSITQYPLSFGMVSQGNIWISMAVLLAITGLLSGSYPAIYLSSFKAVEVLKGKLIHRFSSIRLRSALVVIQFVIAVGLIICVSGMKQQLQFVQSMELGFDKEQKLIIPFRSIDARSKLTVYKNEVLKIPLFKAASGIVYYPGKRVLQDFGVYKQGGDMNSSQQMLMNRTDEDYFNTMGIPLIAGRALQSSDTSDQVVVNETALKSLGIGLNEAPGIKLFSDRDGNREEYQIIGVIKDFNFTSLREEIKPLMFSYAAPERLINLVLSTKTSNYSEAVAEAGNVWQQLNIAEPFEYSFLDENLQKQYESDQTLLGIINGFAALAIFISCMGLFGLSAYAAEQRFKEIGIRKVLGASVFGLIKLLSKDFIALILIACLIAVPLSWMIMGKWLEDFAYRMPAGKLVYLLAVFVTLGIGIIAISVQTLKAALSNPVNSIRSE